MAIIESGTDGNKAKVDGNFRLYVDAVSKDHGGDASERGDSYNINTGILTLTSANKSAVLYLKNTGSNDLNIENLFYLLGNSTGGSGDVLITVLRNPTAGTIVSDKVAAEMAGINRNFGSANTITGDIFKGGETKTFTDGTKVIESIFNQSAQRAALSVGTIILTKGNSIGIEITPATSNSNVDVEFAIGLHEER